VQDSLLRCEASAQYEREAGWLGTLISWRQLVAQRGLFLAYLSRMAKVLKLLKCINREISPRCERVIKRLFIFEKYNLNSRGETPAGCRICSIRCSFLPNSGRSATPAAGLAWATHQRCLLVSFSRGRVVRERRRRRSWQASLLPLSLDPPFFFIAAVRCSGCCVLFGNRRLLSNLWRLRYGHLESSIVRSDDVYPLFSQ